MCYFLFNVFPHLQHHTLYDRFFEKTIVIIMRYFKIIPVHMDKIDKEYIKAMKRNNNCLTKSKAKGTIV